MSDNWMIRSNTFGNCNCDTNCGCQFNVPSTHGFCQFVEGGHISLESINAAPFGVGFEPDFSGLTPEAKWAFDSL